MKSLFLLFALSSANRIISSSSSLSSEDDLSLCVKTLVAITPSLKTFLKDFINAEEYSRLALDFSVILAQSAQGAMSCKAFDYDQVSTFFVSHLNDQGKNCVWESYKVVLLLAVFSNELANGSFKPDQFVEFLTNGAQKFIQVYDDCLHLEINY